jgi:uncharacterized protein YdeI (YjbR/CyaY-like superfamily)
VSERHPHVEVTTRGQWRAWLAEHHADAPGVWLVTFKKATGDRYVPYEDTVEEALCFGWIDSVRRRVDEERSRLLFTPRRSGSAWSRPNKERVERLLADGRMTPAGQAAVDAARADGTWEKLDRVEDLVEPDDLREALDADPDARRHWDAFPRSARRGILEWIGTAKKPETRAKRVGETAELAAQDVRANQWPRR